jgi:hypothetical protein
MDSARHFETLRCFRFHRMWDGSTQPLSLPSCCLALKLPKVELVNEDCCWLAGPSRWRAMLNRHLRCPVSTHEVLASGNAARRLPHLDKAWTIYFCGPTLAFVIEAGWPIMPLPFSLSRARCRCFVSILLFDLLLSQQMRMPRGALSHPIPRSCVLAFA